MCQLSLLGCLHFDGLVSSGRENVSSCASECVDWYINICLFLVLVHPRNQCILLLPPKFIFLLFSLSTFYVIWRWPHFNGSICSFFDLAQVQHLFLRCGAKCFTIKFTWRSWLSADCSHFYLYFFLARFMASFFDGRTIKLFRAPTERPRTKLFRLKKRRD